MAAENVEQHRELHNRLEYHPPPAATISVHEEARARALEFGDWLIDNVPAGWHQSLALTSLQETLMWANAAVACDTPRKAG